MSIFLKAPTFWQNRESLVSAVLAPIGAVYMGITAMRRQISKPVSVSRPVICVGNITAGGTGKTPIVAALAEALQQNGAIPFILTRGYGGQQRQPLRVLRGQHHAELVGDEALLLAQKTPVVVAARRHDAAKLAIEAGATHLLLDDGLQHFTLKQDVRLLVLHGEQGLGNQRGIPAGPLRERLQTLLPHCHAVLLVGEDRHNLAQQCQGVKVVPVRMRAALPTLVSELEPELLGAPALAFCGIGQPENFFRTCEDLGLLLAETEAFPDHQPYSDAMMEKLIHRALAQGAQLYTTEKDWVRVPAKFQNIIHTIGWRAERADGQDWLSLLPRESY